MQEAGQHQGMHRHLQFEIAGACNSVTTENSHNSWRLANNYASSRLPESQLSFQQGGIFRNQTPVSHSPLLSHWSLCPARIPEILTGMAGNSAILAPGNFGLHLNSIGRTALVGSDMIADVKAAWISEYMRS